MTRKLSLIVFVLICLTANLSAQNHLGLAPMMGKGGGGAAMNRDYLAVGVNPANLGIFDDPIMSIGLLNTGVDAFARGLGNIDLLSYRSSFSKDDISDLIGVLQDGGFNMTVDLSWLSASVKSGHLGGFGFSVRDRSSTHIQLGDQAADLLLNGSNAQFFSDTVLTQPFRTSDLLERVDINFLHYRELNFSYGLKLMMGDRFRLFAGAAIKRLYGMGYLSVTSGQNLFEAHSSFLSSYEIDYAQIDEKNINLNQSFFKSAGKGQAFDLGVTIIVGEPEDGGENMMLSLSVVDMGSIRWDQNTFVAENQTITALDPSALPDTRSFAMKDVASSLFDSAALVAFRPIDNFKTNLPAILRLGFAKKFMDALVLGVDIISPLGSRYSVSFQDPYLVVSADILAIPSFTIHTGLSNTRVNGWNIPAGLTWKPGAVVSYQLATADLSTFIRGNGARMSLAAGIRIDLF